MKTFAQDGKNDIRIGRDGQFAMAEGVDAYSTIIADAIRTIQGELQLDIERDIPYFRTVFSSVNGTDIWKAYVRERVLKFPFVKSVDSFDVSFNYEKKELKFVISVSTDAGVATVSSVL